MYILIGFTMVRGSNWSNWWNAVRWSMMVDHWGRDGIWWDQHLYISKCIANDSANVALALKHVTVPLTNDKMVVCLFSETYHCFSEHVSGTGQHCFHFLSGAVAGRCYCMNYDYNNIHGKAWNQELVAMNQNEFMFLFLDSRWIMYNSWMIIYDYIWLYMILYDYIWIYLWLHMILYEWLWVYIYIYREDGNQSIINLYRHGPFSIASRRAVRAQKDRQRCRGNWVRNMSKPVFCWK